MTEKKEAIAFCLTLPNVFEDYPFHDQNWCVIRHRSNKKVFAWIFNRNGYVWINVKCSPEWRDFWRQAFVSVEPAYHLNKEHWNSIILDGTVPEEEIQRMICESYDLTAPKVRGKKGKERFPEYERLSFNCQSDARTGCADIQRSRWNATDGSGIVEAEKRKEGNKHGNIRKSFTVKKSK